MSTARLKYRDGRAADEDRRGGGNGTGSGGVLPDEGSRIKKISPHFRRMAGKWSMFKVCHSLFPGL